MTSKPPHRTRTLSRSSDWATEATEAARRRRDAEAKAMLTEQHHRWRQERAASAAWSPQAEISRIRRV
jgi:hypothetical protein